MVTFAKKGVCLRAVYLKHLLLNLRLNIQGIKLGLAKAVTSIACFKYDGRPSVTCDLCVDE